MRYCLPGFFQRFAWLPLRLFIYGCCRVKIKGVEETKHAKSNVIFASNHLTRIDPFIITACLPFFSNKLPIIYVTRSNKAYRETLQTRLRYFYGGKLFNMIGGYAAYSGLNDYDKALESHLKALASGRSVCIFPVGRTHDANEINEARGGASYMAKKTGLPIIPIRIEGIDRKARLIDCLRRKPRLRIIFGKPIHAREIFERPVEKIDESEREEFEAASVRLMQKIMGFKSTPSSVGRHRKNR